MAFTYTGEMVALGSGRGWLSRPAAESVWRIDRAIGHPLQITEAGRLWAQQNAHWLRYQAYLNGGPWAPIAMDPNAPSVHQKGYAMDSNEAQRIVRLLEDHGWRRTVYRWVNGVWSLVEPWHFEYFSHLDNHRSSGGGGSSSGGGSSPFPPSQEDTLSAAEVAQINAHITAEANRTIIQTADRVMTFVIPSWLPGASNPSLGKLIRALFSESFTPAQRQAITTGYEPGVKLVRFARSEATGSVFVLYEGEDKVRYRFKVTDPAQLEAIGADVAVVPQAVLWDYGPESGKGHAIETDFVPQHPGELIGHAKSEATGNVFSLYRNALGGLVRHLITDPAELEALGDDVPVMAQTELWTYAPTNQ